MQQGLLEHPEVYSAQETEVPHVLSGKLYQRRRREEAENQLLLSWAELLNI